MTIWTSHALYEELRKLIPALPRQCVRCIISLGVNEVARITVVALAEEHDPATGWPVEVTRRFTVVEEETGGG